MTRLDQLHRRVTEHWGATLAGILTVATLLRVVYLNHPGLEWDEGVYDSISANAAHGHGYTAKPQDGLSGGTYLAQPPFYFLLLRLWFAVTGVGIVQARLMSVVASVGFIALAAVLVRRLVSPAAGLLAALLVSVDSWLQFENRIAWIDNTQMVLILALLIAWAAAVKSGSTRSWIITGAALGAVIIFKHIGVAYVIVLALAAVLQRRRIERPVRSLALVFGVAAAITALYASVMWRLFGQAYLTATESQFRRSTGQQSSRGVLALHWSTIRELFSSRLVESHYAIFAGTWIMVLLSGLLMLRRLVAVLRHRAGWDNLELLWAAAAGALVSLAALQLRFPHYFMLVFVPLLCYLAAEVTLLARTPGGGIDRSRLRPSRGVLTAGLALLVLIDVAGGIARVAWTGDNAILQARTWVTVHVPHTAVILADEPIGMNVPQPYCKLEDVAQCAGTPTWAVIYISHTQKLPDNHTLYRLLAPGHTCATFIGFKEVITIRALRGATCPDGTAKQPTDSEPLPRDHVAPAAEQLPARPTRPTPAPVVRSTPGPKAAPTSSTVTPAPKAPARAAVTQRSASPRGTIARWVQQWITRWFGGVAV